MAQQAILIAVENYRQEDLERSLRRADATALAATFELLGFDSALTLVDSDATKTALKSKLKKWVAGMKADNTGYLFHAAHGFSQNGQNYVTS